MAGEWIEVPLGSVAKIIMGQSPPGETYNEIGKGLPFYQGVADFGERYPQKRVYCTSPTRLAEFGDILFSVRAPIGRVNLATEKCAIGRGLAVIRSHDLLDQTFLEFSLRAKSGGWHALESQGSVFGNARKSDLEELSIIWPDDEIRRAIAHILGTLDDKIELNRRMNETLEAMARAIFKSWFVDFYPVRAKAEGRPTGLPKEIEALFPDSFEESELGEIPRGWRVGTLNNIAEVTSGKRPESRSDIRNDVYRVSLFGGSGPMAYTQEALYEHPIILTGRVGTLGIVFRITEPCWPSDNTLVILPREIKSFGFTYHKVCDFNFDSLNRGSTQPLITQSDLQKQSVVIPSSEILDYYHCFISSFFNRVDVNTQQSRTLAAIRDTLLPKLLSGKIRVQDAEKFLKERGL